MKLIAGLGNGCAYKNTRHNLGQDILAVLSKEDDFRDEIERIAGEKVIFIPPECFYNQSGGYIGRAVRFYKADPERDLLVVCDDFYLDFGELRLRLNGSDGGNNGLKSIIQHLGTDKFARLRLGIDNGTKQNRDAEEFVLSKLSTDELKQIPYLAQEVETKIKEWLVLVKDNQ